MFDNFRKEWKIYKFIKQNKDKLIYTDSFRRRWYIDSTTIYVYNWHDIIVDAFDIKSVIVCFMIKLLIEDKIDEERIKNNKKHEQRELEAKDRFLQEHNIK